MKRALGGVQSVLLVHVVLERVTARVRTHEETTVLTESLVAVVKVERSLRDARSRG